MLNAENEDILDAHDVAHMLGLRSGRSLDNRILQGRPVPPWLAVPGLKKRLWLKSAVLIWLAQYEVGSTHP